jgi:hypothetical protein
MPQVGDIRTAVRTRTTGRMRAFRGRCLPLYLRFAVLWLRGCFQSPGSSALDGSRRHLSLSVTRSPAHRGGQRSARWSPSLLPRSGRAGTQRFRQGCGRGSTRCRCTIPLRRLGLRRTHPNGGAGAVQGGQTRLGPFPRAYGRQSLQRSTAPSRLGYGGPIGPRPQDASGRP